jgi:adenine-specific DNA-methyltransferase
MPGSRRTRTKTPQRAETYKHPEADSAMRPEVGTQSHFRKKKPPAEYRYDSSLSPALDWDTNPAREEVLLQAIQPEVTTGEEPALGVPDGPRYGQCPPSAR